MKQKQYIHLQDEGDEYWIELDEENFARRQIIKDSSGKFHLSCFEDCLAEGSLEELCYMNSIIYDEFQQIWNKYLSVNLKNWENVKKKYKIGSRVHLRVEYYYPQGIILKGSDFTAVYIGNNNYSLHEEIILQVVQYDDENLWVVVM